MDAADIRQKQDKPGARTEADRVEAEREALIAGLATEVSRVYEKLDHCEDTVRDLILTVKKQGADIRKLTRSVDKFIVGHLLPPGLGNGHDEDD